MSVLLGSVPATTHTCELTHQVPLDEPTAHLHHIPESLYGNLAGGGVGGASATNTLQSFWGCIYKLPLPASGRGIVVTLRHSHHSFQSLLFCLFFFFSLRPTLADSWQAFLHDVTCPDSSVAPSCRFLYICIYICFFVKWLRLFRWEMPSSLQPFLFFCFVFAVLCCGVACVSMSQHALHTEGQVCSWCWRRPGFLF